MKRFLVSLLIMLLISVSALADLPDFSSMSFEELFAYKQAVDSEYNSRPESEGITLSNGIYTVGEDIMPGHYYVGMVYPGMLYNQSLVAIYNDMETYKQEEPHYTKLAKEAFYAFLSDDPKSIILEDKNVIIIEEGSLFMKASPFNPTDYYAYTPPEGTLVPQGKYIVGEDIPAGTYNFYPATTKTGEFKAYGYATKDNGETETVYRTRWSGSAYVSVYSEIECETVALEENDIVEVHQAVVMSKKPKLNFD